MYDTDGTGDAASGILLHSSGSTFTQEVIANTTGDSRISLLGGVFFIADDSKRDPQSTFTTNLQTGVRRTDVDVKTIAFAPFGEITFKVSDRFNLIGGLRYSYERKHLRNSLNGISMRDESTSWDNLSYRITAQYYVNPDLNIYATRSTGFKSGTYNAASFTNPPVRPETVTAHELGLKYSSGGIVLNGDVFYYQQKDLQVQRAFDANTGSSQLENAARARIYGIEAEFHGRVTDFLNIDIGGSWMKGRYTSYPLADVTVPIPGGGNSAVGVDVTGRPTYRTPDLTFNAGFTFTHELLGGTFTASSAIYHSSGFSWEASNRLREAAHDLVNARVSWSPANERFRVSFWGENLTDEFYYVNAVAGTASDAGNMGAPRRFGVSLSIKTN
jgi:iron complex outermembrane receptor protein